MSNDLLDRIDFPKLLEDMGFSDVDATLPSYLGYCLFHNDQNTKSFSANLESKLFHCFGCGAKGNAIQLYAKWRNVDIAIAKQELEELPEVRSVEYLEAQLKPYDKLPVWKKLEILTAYKNAMPLLTTVPELKKYMNDRGISDKTLDTYDVRAYKQWSSCPYSYGDQLHAGVLDTGETVTSFRERFVNHTILFMFKVAGQVTYIQGRMSREPAGSDLKYLGIRGGVTHAFNHDVVIDPNVDHIFVCEGAMDTLSMIELGYTNSIGIIGVEGFKPSWIEDSKVKLITLALDNDRAGNEAFTKLSASFRQKNIEVNKFLFPTEFKDVNQFLCSKKSV